MSPASNTTDPFPLFEDTLGTMVNQIPLNPRHYIPLATGNVNTVFAPADPAKFGIVHKRAESASGKQALRNDYDTSVKASIAMQFARFHNIPVDAHVPIPMTYKSGVQFRGNFLPSDVFTMERIFPVPERFRRLVLANTTMQAPLRRVMRDTPQWKHCLLKPYMGADESSWSFEGPSSMQDYPLLTKTYLKAFGGLNFSELCKQMGRCLALLHWHAEVDGTGVKFVLGAGGEEPGLPCSIIIWMTDFDQCKPLDMSPEKKDELFAAYFQSAPQLPRPDQPGWEIFKKEYTSTSCWINMKRGLCSDWERSRLPWLFVYGIERWARMLRADPRETVTSQARCDIRSPRAAEVQQFYDKQNEYIRQRNEYLRQRNEYVRQFTEPEFHPMDFEEQFPITDCSPTSLADSFNAFPHLPRQAREAGGFALNGGAPAFQPASWTSAGELGRCPMTFYAGDPVIHQNGVPENRSDSGFAEEQSWRRSQQ